MKSHRDFCDPEESPGNKAKPNKSPGDDSWEAKPYLKKIWTLSDIGILIVDVKKREIADLNPCALKLIGGTKDQVIGRVCHGFLCPASVGRCPIMDLNKPMENLEHMLLGRRGEKILILKNAVMLMRESRRYLIESFLNINDLVRVRSVSGQEPRESGGSEQGDVEGAAGPYGRLLFDRRAWAERRCGKGRRDMALGGGHGGLDKRGVKDRRALEDPRNVADLRSTAYHQLAKDKRKAVDNIIGLLERQVVG